MSEYITYSARGNSDGTAEVIFKVLGEDDYVSVCRCATIEDANRCVAHLVQMKAGESERMDALAEMLIKKAVSKKAVESS